MNKEERLIQAHLLVEQLEAGNDAAAEQTLKQLAGVDSELFNEVGRLTRELHEEIKNFLHDQRITQLANKEIPDTRERLSYVIEMTEKSANTTLGAVENSLPIADQIGQQASALGEQWERFRTRKLDVEDFRLLSQDLSGFLDATTGHVKQLQSELSAVLLAQEFQDLIGQIIRQVMTIVKDVEEKLVELIRITGSKIPEGQQVHEVMDGPEIPSINDGDRVHGQDEVDDLLSSLGF